MWSSWSLLLMLLGPYTSSKVHKSPCVGGMILPPRNLHPGATSKIKKHEIPIYCTTDGCCALEYARIFALPAALASMPTPGSAVQCFWLKTNKNKSYREIGKDFEKIETSLDESNFRCFKIWQLHNLSQSIVTGPALAALAAWKFRMLSMPWQNDTGLQAGRRGKSWFWYLYFCGSLTVFESLAFRVNCNICSLKNGR